MKCQPTKLTASFLPIILGVAIVFSLTEIEVAAQDDTLKKTPLIKESQKTDRQEQLREEIVELDDLIEREPQNAAAYEMRASHYYQLKQCDKATLDYTRLIEINPRARPGVIWDGAEIYKILGKPDKAADAIVKARGF